MPAKIAAILSDTRALNGPEAQSRAPSGVEIGMAAATHTASLLTPGHSLLAGRMFLVSRCGNFASSPRKSFIYFGKYRPLPPGRAAGAQNSLMAGNFRNYTCANASGLRSK